MTLGGNLCFIKGVDRSIANCTAQTRLSDVIALAHRRKSWALVSICIETFRQAMCVCGPRSESNTSGNSEVLMTRESWLFSDPGKVCLAEPDTAACGPRS